MGLLTMVDAKGEMATVLRWFSVAADLAERLDRRFALKDRAAKVPLYLRRAEEAFAFITTRATDDQQELRDSVTSDYDRCMELADRIVDAWGRLEEERSDTPSFDPKHVLEPAFSRLPVLAVPKFLGKEEQWTSFLSMFDSLVDSRPDLSSAQKMAYLLGALEGEAKELTQHLSIEDHNYKSARDLLYRRYQNVRRLADVHVGNILALPAVTRLSTLRTALLNPLMVAINALEKLGLPVEQWSFLLLHIVLNKLPAGLRVRFEHCYGGDTATYLPPFTDLVRFLEDECRLMDNAHPTPTATLVSGGQNAGVPQRSRRQQADHGNVPVRRMLAATPVPTNGCKYCKLDNHSVLRCPEFARLPLAERRRFARNRRICFVCLCDHFSRNCPDPRPCGQCGGMHHLILCANRNGTQEPAPTQVCTGGGASASGARTPPKSPPAGRYAHAQSQAEVYTAEPGRFSSPTQWVQNPYECSFPQPQRPRRNRRRRSQVISNARTEDTSHGPRPEWPETLMNGPMAASPPRRVTRRNIPGLEPL